MNTRNESESAEQALRRDQMGEDGRREAAAGPEAAPPPPLASSLNAADDFLHLAVPVTRQVTRQVQISGPSQWKHLACGVDSLDLGLHVWWGETWGRLSTALANGKRSAERTEGILWHYSGAGECLILPRGKAPMYAYHLQTPDFHLFIADRAESASYPNVYVSILSRSLWLRGPRPAINLVLAFIKRLGGRVGECVPSRADLCADFFIPGGLSLDFLLHHLVSRSKKTDHRMDDGILETFYVGAPGAPVLARIYDKAREILIGGEKLWFLDIWKLQECRDIWRVEFQVRRLVLKQLMVEGVDWLVEISGGLWRYLTDSWMSLRVQDDENATRRSVHPWWLVVQAVGNDFGSQLEVKRKYAKGGQAPVEWYTSHASGCLAGFAARQGIDDLDSALGLLAQAMREHWASRDFQQRYRTDRVKLGFDDRSADGQS